MIKLNRNIEWKKWKGKATGRKGMGMELALLVLFVVFGCTILLVSSALIGKSNMNDRKDELTEKLVLTDLAEGFLSESLTEDVIEDSENSEELKKKFAGYAVFQCAGGETDWTRLWTGGASTGEADAELPAADSFATALLIADLAGNPLLTVAVNGEGEIILWNYH